MSRKVAWSFDFSSTIRSPLPSLVTSMVSLPRIDFNSLWILKGDMSATFADPFELITINFFFFNGDQPAKGDTLIKVGRSSTFLLLATEAAPRAASVQGFFATSSCGEGSEGFFFFLDSEKNDQPIGQRGSALPSRFRRRKWPRRHDDE
ncbi:hypothetical protein PoB_000755400 [Plakobranchus ocellatus]|uniref:Uncharacterized protein n=1 Tax=Plakobranchus ocellatus TaxID=259542 RepID=A0AAV3YFH7_9GAST|nr:hypothetical protein PoB_000755400 [Plakobranchus ocellatus]